MPRWAASSGTTTREQAGVRRQPQPDGRPRRLEQPRQLRADPLARQVLDQPGVLGDRRQRRRLDRELVRRREPDRADHPQRVLVEPARPDRRPRAGVRPRGRRARRTGRRARSGGDPPRRRRRSLAGPPQAIALTVKSRRARSCVEVVPELDPVGPAVVGVVVLEPEGRDLEHLAARGARRRSRSGSRRPRPGTARAISRRSRVGREVPVRGRRDRAARRAATRRRRTRRGRAARSRSRTAPTVGGISAARRAAAPAASGPATAGPSVPAEEEVASSRPRSARPGGTA